MKQFFPHILYGLAHPNTHRFALPFPIALNLISFPSNGSSTPFLDLPPFLRQSLSQFLIYPQYPQISLFQFSRRRELEAIVTNHHLCGAASPISSSSAAVSTFHCRACFLVVFSSANALPSFHLHGIVLPEPGATPPTPCYSTVSSICATVAAALAPPPFSELAVSVSLGSKQQQGALPHCSTRLPSRLASTAAPLAHTRLLNPRSRNSSPQRRPILGSFHHLLYLFSISNSISSLIVFLLMVRLYNDFGYKLLEL